MCKSSRTSNGLPSVLQARKAHEIEAAFGCGWSARWMNSTLPGISATTLPVCCLRRHRNGWRNSSSSSIPGSPMHAIMRCFGRCITRGCARTRRRRWNGWTCISVAPFGKAVCPLRRGAPNTSGPRPRRVPMLDGLDLVLRSFLDGVRGRFPDGRGTIVAAKQQSVRAPSYRSGGPDHCLGTSRALGPGPSMFHAMTRRGWMRRRSLLNPSINGRSSMRMSARPRISSPRPVWPPGPTGFSA
jgi:hypothetical protein